MILYTVEFGYKFSEGTNKIIRLYQSDDITGSLS